MVSARELGLRVGTYWLASKIDHHSSIQLLDGMGAALVAESYVDLAGQVELEQTAAGKRRSSRIYFWRWTEQAGLVLAGAVNGDGQADMIEGAWGSSMLDLYRSAMNDQAVVRLRRYCGIEDAPLAPDMIDLDDPRLNSPE